MVTVIVPDWVNVPLLTDKLLLIVFVPPFEKVVVPAPDLVKLWKVIAPVVPPPISVPETVTVGVPALVPITPDVALVRFPVIPMVEFKFKVVLAPTATLLLTVFVPEPVKVVVPVVVVARLQKVIAPEPPVNVPEA